MSAPKLWAVLPAAGSGRRFSTTELKQYQMISGKTVLEHSVTALYQLPLAGCVIAISPQDTFAQQIDFQHPIEFCLGGQERVDSVLAGLYHLKHLAQADDYVLVHDAARPCLHRAQIEQILAFCQSNEAAAILAVPVRDTLKKANAEYLIDKTISREQLWQAQTPQIVKYALLMQALETAIVQKSLVTDEASALELLDIPVKLLLGRTDNLKITYPEDLALADFILTAFHLGNTALSNKQ
ncbi:MAG: 2-C-methyl-D-erythritol 4-phosphate cytidylyltransferase [Acinetobacter sp.]|jgi:2-C-methyl-D-erythritol 4-phosphate cytidylyltransferase|nr:MAG: 2-C-methyl-D-erythritol 4-phosphate cytidylyltransferase [Acinetobacter sp.]